MGLHLQIPKPATIQKIIEAEFTVAEMDDFEKNLEQEGLLCS